MIFKFLVILFISDLVAILLNSLLVFIATAPMVIIVNNLTRKVAAPLMFTCAAFSAFVQLYFWGAWAAFCVELARQFSDHPSVSVDWI
jgi:hypothetical protein